MAPEVFGPKSDEVVTLETVFGGTVVLTASGCFLEAVWAVEAGWAAAVVADGLLDPQLEAVDEFDEDFSIVFSTMPVELEVKVDGLKGSRVE